LNPKKQPYIQPKGLRDIHHFFSTLLNFISKFYIWETLSNYSDQKFHKNEIFFPAHLCIAAQVRLTPRPSGPEGDMVVIDPCGRTHTFPVHLPEKTPAGDGSSYILRGFFILDGLAGYSP